MHEDDWRQVEFVGLTQQPEVEAELERLRSFKAQHSKGIGFTDVYVRHGRPDGLVPLQIENAALESLLPSTARRRALVVGPVVVNGFAVELDPDAVLCVHVADEHLATVGLPLSWRRGSSAAADDVLATVARALGLRLVHWPATTWLDLE
jgi:hypothetical protein